MQDFKGKDNKKGARLGHNKIAATSRTPKTVSIAQKHGQCQESTSESQAWSLRKQKEEGAGANTAQAEADTDGSGGEEHGLEFPISAVLYESESCPSQMHVVFTENDDLLFSHE